MVKYVLNDQNVANGGTATNNVIGSVKQAVKKWC